MDSVAGGARIRGRVALNLGDEKSVDGEVGMDTLDLAPAFGLAIGAAGRDTSEPLGRGLLQGWRGRLAFQALRGTLPGGGELRPVSGIIKGDGQSLTFDNLKGTIGGGEATADIEAKQTLSGVALNARLQFSGVDGSALRYRALAMPAGRASMQMTLASQGRSASALAGALSGSGSLTLEFGAHCRPRSAGVRRRDPRQRQWAGHRRHQTSADRRAGAVSRGHCRSRRRKSRSISRTGGCASARQRSMPKAHAPLCPAVTICPPIKPIFAPLSLRPPPVRRPAVRKFRSLPWDRPMRSIAPSMSRRCRHGWR